MSSSYIEFAEKGFWSKDGFVEAIQICLINEIEDTEISNDSWLAEYKNELALESLPLIYGGMSLKLDDFLIGDNRKKTLINLIDNVCIKISKNAEYLTGENFHKFRTRAIEILWVTGQVEFENEVEFKKVINDSMWSGSKIHEAKDRYLHGFKLLKELIQGKLDTEGKSPNDYWNY